MTGTISAVKISREVQSLIKIIIVLLGNLWVNSRHLDLRCICYALPSSQSHILLSSLLHQHIMDHMVIWYGALNGSFCKHTCITAHSMGWAGQLEMAEVVSWEHKFRQAQFPGNLDLSYRTFVHAII